MRQLSSLDMHFLVKELKSLEGSRIDKIYQPEANLIIFSFHKSNVGKKILKIDVGKSVFIANEKDSGETLGFGMFLRKHLDGFFLNTISQIEPERVVRFDFSTKTDKKTLYIEMFGKGNAILCDDHNVILNALVHHDFRERSIRPKLKYNYPMMEFNMFRLNESDLSSMLKNSKKDSVVTALAIGLGLGGLYSEEVCLLGNVDKNINPKDIDEKQIHSIIKSIKRIINHKIESKAIIDNGKVIDFVPFGFELYSATNYEKKDFDDFNSAAAYFFSQFKEEKETEYDKKLRSLNHIIEQQKESIEKLRKDEKEHRGKGEMIYHNYQLIKEVLDEMNKASKKYSWKEIKEKLKNHKVIKEVNAKDRKVVVEV